MKETLQERQSCMLQYILCFTCLSPANHRSKSQFPNQGTTKNGHIKARKKKEKEQNENEISLRIRKKVKQQVVRAEQEANKSARNKAASRALFFSFKAEQPPTPAPLLSPLSL